MALNLTSPTEFTGLVVAETVHTPGGSSDSIDPGLTKSGGLPAAAVAEFRSTHGGLLLPRLTNTQINAISQDDTVSLIPGTILFNSDVKSLNVATGSDGAFTSVAQISSFTLTSAQLLALHATPVIALPAPGPGFMLDVDRVTVEYVFNTTAYTVPGGAAFTFTVGGVPVGTNLPAAGFVDQVVNKVYTTAAAIAVTSVSTLANQGVSITNTVGNLTLGDGTVKLNFWYTIFAV